MNCVFPDYQNQDSVSNMDRATDGVCEWKWCGGITLTATFITKLVCLPFKYQNKNAQCCCAQFSDKWKTPCLIVDLIYFIVMIVLFPLFLIIAIIVDIIQIILGLLCCLNFCCRPCSMYECCKYVPSVEHNKKFIVDV